VPKASHIIEVNATTNKIYENYNCISRMVSCYFPNVSFTKV